MGRLTPAGAALLCLCAVVGPVLLALLAVLYTGRPSPYFLGIGVALAVAILACDTWIVARRHWITGGFALTSQIAFLIFVGGYAASPFPAPSHVSDALPQASLPADMAVYVLRTG
jgi:drug/metabolite transporter (DMT)-like permease